MKKTSFIVFVLFWVGSTFGLGMTASAKAQGWTRHYINQLPDASFAVIEIDSVGRKHRHCPYRDVNGTIDTEQLIFVLGTLEHETWIDANNEAIVQKQLAQHYQRQMDAHKSGVEYPINLNTASLSDLVQLPHIGPVLAVNIIEHRQKQAVFRSIEEVRQVNGVGQGTLDAIRYYVRFE